MFLFKQVEEWVTHPQTKHDFCQVTELGPENTCQEMMAYTLLKAVEDLTTRLGPYNSSKWAMKKLKKVRYEHPLGTTPLRDYFEELRLEDGGKRTPKMQRSSHHDENDAFVVSWGSTFRSLFDLSEPTSAYFSIDSELN